ncbi:MAG: PEP-CTERM sorting domain-containing protein [Desulfobacteraceae bacterium]|jgi:hypothetical protein
MKKLLTLFTIILTVLSVSASAYAYQYASGLAVMDLGSFDYSYRCAGEANCNETGAVGYREIGVYSAGIAYAFDEYSEDVGAFHSYVLDGWAEAYSNGAFAYTGFDGNLTGSVAEAKAGDGYGAESGAFAGTFVAAYGFYALTDIYLTIQMDYYLEGEVGGDGFGYSEAGSGAILGILSEDDNDLQGDWLSVNSSNGAEYYWEDETLFASVLLGAGDCLTIFAGTAAYAYANEVNAVPEPDTMILLGAGFLVMAGLGRKRLIKG